MQQVFSPFPVFGISGGVAHVFIGQTKLYETSRPSFLLDTAYGQVLRHGDEEEIRKLHDGMCASYRNNELDETELQVICFDAGQIPAETLDQFVRDPAALAQWHSQKTQWERLPLAA